MIPVLLILIPLLAGLASFFIKNEKTARAWALLAAIVTLGVSLLGITVITDARHLQHECRWMESIGASFSVKLDGMGQLLCLLNAVAYPVVLLATWKTNYRKANNFFALMLLAQAGMMGVFLAMDALLFYFFWELALIPMYFLCSQWGGERRIAVTFKFFIYTFIGSLLMLVGILYIWSKSADHSFSISSFYTLWVTPKEQLFLFWLFFAAFAIKMPIFPLHTWQPDTYEQAPAATTMILSGVMVKMGVFGIVRWLMPVLPYSSFMWGDMVTAFAVTGMIYASLIAIRQDSLRKLVAYSSIAHIGLMCAAVFSETESGVQGAMIQMFSHGINIIGLWIVVGIIERQFGVKKISELGGLAQKAPSMTIMFVIVALANIALPLTNAFAGEFLMFNGVFNSLGSKYPVLLTVLAGTSIILAAVYTLNMIRKVFYGHTNELTATITDLGLTEKIALGAIVAMIFVFGVYPQALLNLTQEFTDTFLSKVVLVKK
ncbi:MAG: NADH-quinone oxidoreductase subunit M [Chitinophagaceae bacterium]|nr:NADH-quinone oxidoreductase subunit M [Chitinophagaceae bacterium]